MHEFITEIIPVVAGLIPAVALSPSAEFWTATLPPVVETAVSLAMKSAICRPKKTKTNWPDGTPVLFKGAGLTGDEASIELPLANSQTSSAEQWQETLKRLRIVSMKMCADQEPVDYIFSSSGLPINAAIAIGYAFHENNHLGTYYQQRDKNGNVVCFGSAAKAKPLKFDTPRIRNPKSIIASDGIDLCIYLRAKKDGDGDSIFDEYTNQWLLSPRVAIARKYINCDNYDSETDLTLTAEELASRIRKEYDDAQKKFGSKNVDLHIFFNGFWGLALMLGSKLPQIYPIFLHDYDASTKRYKPAICLLPSHFRKARMPDATM